MTPDQFRIALETFGLTQRACAKFLGVEDRNVRRWATGDHDVPKSVAALFALMDEFNLTPEDVDRMLDGGG